MDLGYLYQRIIFEIIRPVLTWSINFNGYTLNLTTIFIFGGLIWIIVRFLKSIIF